jgi:hypothetical protein
MKGLSVCPSQAFPASLMFAGKGGAYLSEVPFRVPCKVVSWAYPQALD